MIPVPKSRAPEYIAPKASTEPKNRHLEHTFIHAIDPNSLPTLKVPISTSKTTYLTVVDLVTHAPVTVYFVPVNPTLFKVLSVSDNSKITLGTFVVLDTTPIYATVTSHGKAGERTCFLGFRNWTWPILKETVGGAQSWFSTEVAEVTTDSTEKATVPAGDAAPAVEAQAPQQGEVLTFRIKGEDRMEIIAQELPNGEAQWFFSNNGRVAWCGMGRAHSDGRAYRLFVENGSVFVHTPQASVCVGPAGLPQEQKLAIEVY